jgi:hypothetical protein
MVLKTLAKLSPVESVRGEEGRRNERERANQKVYGLRARKKKIGRDVSPCLRLTY